MVRVISQGFTTPRSRHSSGEDMIDRFAAMAAVSALNDNEKQYFYKDSNQNLQTKKLVIDCNTDTNDSFSCGESEEDAKSERGEERALQASPSCQDPVVMKKERRRERNKLSAQTYRQRRKVQTSAIQKTLESLEAHHKELLEKVRHLEAEKHIVEEYLKNCVKIPWCPYHHLSKPANCSPPTIPEDAHESPCSPCSPGTCANRCVPDANANTIPNSLRPGLTPSLPQMQMQPSSDMSLSMSGVAAAQNINSPVS